MTPYPNKALGVRTSTYKFGGGRSVQFNLYEALKAPKKEQPPWLAVRLHYFRNVKRSARATGRSALREQVVTPGRSSATQAVPTHASPLEPAAPHSPRSSPKPNLGFEGRARGKRSQQPRSHEAVRGRSPRPPGGTASWRRLVLQAAGQTRGESPRPGLLSTRLSVRALAPIAARRPATSQHSSAHPDRRHGLTPGSGHPGGSSISSGSVERRETNGRRRGETWLEAQL